MFSLFLYFSCSATERAVVSLWLNNWDKENPIIGFWTGAQNSWTVGPSQFPGIQGLRAYDSLTTDIIKQDSFAVKIDDTVYSDPKLFNSTHLGGAVQEQTGEIWTLYTLYDGKELPVTINRSFSMVPNTQFYMVQTTFESNDGKQHQIELLDFATNNNSPKVKCSDNACTFDTSGSGVPILIVAGDKSNKNYVTYAGPSDTTEETNPLNMFSQGKFPTQTSNFSGNAMVATLYSSLPLSSEPITITSYRILGRNVADAETNYNAVMTNNVDYWMTQMHSAYKEFLLRGIQPQLTGDADDLYKKSLIILKNSQNPKIGAIASSMHPLYGYKNWARDSLMAAFMLDACGYHDEAKSFMEFIPTVEKDSNGGWFTCYNTFNGAHDGFVEPQYDSMGLFPIAINYHHQCFGDLLWVKQRMGQVEECAEFLMKKGKHFLGLSDYAPWEESSDHHVKPTLPFPTKYYTFTQGLYYGGLIACAKLEEAFGQIEKANKYRARAAELKEAVNKYLYHDGKYLRSRVDNSTFAAEYFADSASLSVVFAGLADDEQSLSHINFINQTLDGLNGGISRYENDPYFYDSQWNPCGDGTKETQVPMPIWPVTTAYMAWSEHRLGLSFQRRLDFMVKYAAYGNMPIGEAVDRKDGALIPPSAPDSFEHGGVYVFTTLLEQGKARSIYSTLQ